MKIGLLIPQGYFDEFDGWQPVGAWERMLALAERGRAARVRVPLDRRARAVQVGSQAHDVRLHHARARAGRAVPRRRDRLHASSTPPSDNPAMTAKFAGTLDAICGGRRSWASAAGFKVSEADAMGVPFPGIGERLDDPRRAPRDHQPADARRPRAAVHLRGRAHLGQGRRECAPDRRPGPHPAAHRRAWPERDLPARGEVLRRDQHRPCRRDHAGGDQGAGGPLRRDRPRPDDAGYRWASIPLAVRGAAGDRSPADDGAGGRAGDHARTTPASRRARPRWPRGARWASSGIVVGAPGMADTDESLDELVEDLHAAGLQLTPPTTASA